MFDKRCSGRVPRIPTTTADIEGIPSYVSGRTELSYAVSICGYN